MKTKLTPPLALEIFDSRNTSIKGNPYWNTPKEQVLSYAKVSSFPFKCIVSDVNGNWIEYEKGKIVSWSTSLGMAVPN